MTERAQIAIPSGSFFMGSNDHYPEERPERAVKVDTFSIDTYAVTNADFRHFIDATGYKTTAEVPINPADAPGVPLDMLAAGSLVFRMSKGAVDLREFRNWWYFVQGANWQNPQGPGSHIDGLEDHPVVHVSYFDAQAFTKWSGCRLPTEKEWEYAATGGKTWTYPWGKEIEPRGKRMANTWKGKFPFQNDVHSGTVFTESVNAYQPNGFGLYNMIGNVWEWTSSRTSPSGQSNCCTPATSVVDGEMLIAKGGSHLCAASYCRRYRRTAKTPQEARSSTSHMGFRCASS
ncbi:MAG: sulfatase modifying factor 1 [Paracoccaceae bacterium]|jgi:sulfatase modifying factor 1